jgi:hemin uptake protein HemP
LKIKFSRHAKRRAQLYKIPEEIVRKILEGKELIQGDQEIIENVEGFKYPLKIVVSTEGDIITVVTNYPLKKGRKR